MASEDYLCPNCVTPWKCNGPHIPECPDCGYPEDSFACKIRHVSIATGWAKKYH